MQIFLCLECKITVLFFLGLTKIMNFSASLALKGQNDIVYFVDSRNSVNLHVKISI